MNRDPSTLRQEGRLVDRAFILTVVTLLLLTPPILNIFNARLLVFGIPLLHVYCYGVWLTAVACGGWLAAHMGGDEPGAGSEPTER